MSLFFKIAMIGQFVQNLETILTYGVLIFSNEGIIFKKLYIIDTTFSTSIVIRNLICLFHCIN